MVGPTNLMIMKKILFTLCALMAALTCYGQKVEKIFDEAALYYDAGDYEKAIPLLEKCLMKKYYSEGNIYYMLSESYNNIGDKSKRKLYAVRGLENFPKNRCLLLEIIEIYLEENDTDRALRYLEQALYVEPSNASLHYVKGTIYLEKGDTKAAMDAFKQCTIVDPQFEHGLTQIGVYYYNKAIELQNLAANELDDDKYNRLLEEMNDNLVNSCETLEKAFSVTKDLSIKISIAEYLYNIYNHFSDEEQADFYRSYMESGGEI